MNCSQFNRFSCDSKCIPIDFLCDLNQDCIDGSDEGKHCPYWNTNSTRECKNLIKKMESRRCYIEYNTMGRMISKVHQPLETLKDCPKDINCLIGFYKCKSVNYCISIQQFCDDIPHCPLNDDEINCGPS